MLIESNHLLHLRISCHLEDTKESAEGSPEPVGKGCLFPVLPLGLQHLSHVAMTCPILITLLEKREPGIQSLGY